MCTLKRDNPVISLITINYHDVEMTASCVAIAKKSCEEAKVTYEILVVDNSGWETGELLRKSVPADTKIIINMENVGFAKACNEAAMRAEGKFLLFVNNDARINGETVSRGMRYLTTHEEVGIWSCKLLSNSGVVQQSYSKFPTILSVAKEYLLGRTELHTVNDGDDVVYVDVVVGAVVMIPASLYLDLEGFSEKYFFTSEDVDLCRRMAINHKLVVWDPSASAVHIGGASQNYDWISDPYLHKYRVAYFRNNHGRIAATIISVIIIAGLSLRKIKKHFPV